MKNIILNLSILISISFFAQAQKKNSEIDILKIITHNASTLQNINGGNSVSIGVIKDGKTFTKHFGELNIGKGNKATNETLFEIASITKIFTGLLMAKAVLEKKADLEDDIRKYLTENYTNLEFQRKPIKIRDLLSFKSGFSKDLPDNSEIRKNGNDSVTFNLKKLDQSYNKNQFFKDLKQIKLDTFPGTKYNYNNLNLELTAHILENIYKKSYQTLLTENIISKLEMNSTQMSITDESLIANGYNENNILMPKMSNNLWGSAGFLKSTLNDLLKLMKFELNPHNKIATESQKNLNNDNQNWNGYFWDLIKVDENGKSCWKHGGAYGSQTMFVIYPELNLGISIITNKSGSKTSDAIHKTISDIVEDLKPESNPKSKLEIYGYKLSENDIIFTYKHNTSLNSQLVKTISVAGSFNEWNPNNSKYKMVRKNNNYFELKIPKSEFTMENNYLFKFVINNENWISTPKNAINAEKNEDRNLILKLK